MWCDSRWASDEAGSGSPDVVADSGDDRRADSDASRVEGAVMLETFAPDCATPITAMQEKAPATLIRQELSAACVSLSEQPLPERRRERADIASGLLWGSVAFGGSDQGHQHTVEPMPETARVSS